MTKTKDDLLKELERVAPEVFKTIQPGEVIKADLERLIAAATGPGPAPSTKTETDDLAPEGVDDNDPGDTPEDDDANDTPPGDVSEQTVALLFEKWGVCPDHRELVGLAMAAYNLSPDDVFAVKIISPKEVKIITVAGQKCEFIDCRVPG